MVNYHFKSMKVDKNLELVLATNIEHGVLCQETSGMYTTKKTTTSHTTTTTTTTTSSPTTTTATATTDATTAGRTTIFTTTNSNISGSSSLSFSKSNDSFPIGIPGKEFQIQMYIQSIERRLTNFERLLDSKIVNFALLIFSVDSKARLVWMMVTEDLVKQVVESHKKKEKMKNIKSVFKLIETIFLLSFSLGLLYIFYCMYRSLQQKYANKKAAKEKRKRELKKKRKRILTTL